MPAKKKRRERKPERQYEYLRHYIRIASIKEQGDNTETCQSEQKC